MHAISLSSRLRAPLALAALAASVAAMANTGTVTVSANLPYADTNWNNSLVFPKFDSTLFNLDSVELGFHGAINSTMRFENRNATARDYSAQVGYNIVLNRPAGGALLTVNPNSNSVSGNLPAFDGTSDFGGTSGITYPQVTADASGTATLTDANDLSAFIGSGNVSLLVNASASSSVVGSGNFARSISTQAAADVTVTYHYSYTPASVGDRVWVDANNNGLQDAGERGLGGVTVVLLDGSGAQVGQTTTDSNGIYKFSELVPGEYQVRFDAPAGTILTGADAGDDALDSDALTGGLTTKFILHSGENRTDLDAGVVGNQSVGDYVWFDANADGKQDSSELGIANIGVTLFDTAGNTVGTTLTDENGKYLFSGLLPGDYKVQFAKPSTYAYSPLSAGGDTGLDSDAKNDGMTATFTLAPGQDRRDIDAGMYGLVSLGDRIWFDANANGKQDDGEKGIPNLDVTLLSGSGATLGTVKTDSNGNYMFDDLMPGAYRVQFSKPVGYNYTVADAGTDDLIDSDADGAGLSPVINVTSDRTDVDAGLVGTLCLGDRAWRDDDKDGLQDSCEPGVKDVIVRLLDANGNVIAETKTDANGYYRFTNLAPGDYTVDFDAPSGYGFTKQFANAAYKQYDSNVDPATGKATVTLTANDSTIDAGLIGALKIGDTVWLDSDGDTHYEPEIGERGIPNVKVFLVGDTNGDGWPDVATYTTTDKDGHYTFLGLKPGNYSVTVNAFDLSSRLVPTYDLDGIGTRHIAIGKLTTADRLDFDFGYKVNTTCYGGSHGWWSCYPTKWSCDVIWVGGKCHTKATICAWLKKNDCGDKSIALYQRLCAAKLNVGDGCNESVRFTCGRTTLSVKDAIKLADAWLSKNPVGCGVSSSSSKWTSICDVFGILDKYCSGR